MSKIIRSIEVNESTQEVKLTFSGSGQVNLMEILILWEPDKRVEFESLVKGFEILGSYDGRGFTLGRKGGYHVTFARVSPGITRVGRMPYQFAQRYRGVSFPGTEA